ncbi:TetR/AcrR family transcriptional regulator [Amycolatopsis sp. H20-H5]|uniref:TetR/AcrR family transcriptional regulator n=1 Tax=Amycolatopsis sp. H20-H5 TaxID=3046309 RepID=UPI002DB9BF7B|nr:TetR/AcrR family transcriptional regulator [Amycolatopsis sp. H20-H5]MEC3979104.1 TetR/AcrR family transcriptional regulator [Amycolatopsis sp. H20-H5]
MSGSEVKAKLVDAAVRLLAEGGPETLQARKLAAEVGASTMAVYTHFGGMGALVDAVAREGFRQLSANLAQVPVTADPIADIFAQALAYRATAVGNPQLFAVTFGQSSPGGKRASLQNLTAEENRSKPHDGLEAFGYLERSSARAIEAGRFHPIEPFTAAAQLWSALHGYVTLETSGHFGDDEQGIVHILMPLGVTLAVGLGDTMDAAQRSAAVARTTWSDAQRNANGHSGDVQVTSEPAQATFGRAPDV